ncbi:MAG: TonB-dependent receptor [Bacteroidota bacterium]
MYSKTILLAVLILFYLTVSAQENSITAKLDEVIVTANRTNTPSIEIASSYTIIGEEDLKKHQTKSVLEILRTVEGVNIVQSGGSGKISKIYIRGANPHHTLVLIDGVKVNDTSSPNNAFDFANLSTDNIERIEIIRGAQSTIYGSEAMAGVVNIITKSSIDKFTSNISAESGSNNYFNGSLSSSGAFDFLKFSIALSQFSTDGFSSISKKYGNTERDGFFNQTASARLIADLSKSTKLDFIYRFNSSSTDLDQSEKYGDDPNYTGENEEHLFKAEVTNSLFNSKWESKLSAALTRKIARTTDKLDALHPNIASNSYNNSTRKNVVWLNTIDFIPSNKMTAGIEVQRESASTSFISVSQWGPYESKFPLREFSTYSGFLHDQINIGSKLFTGVGVRYDNHEQFGGKITYRIAPAYLLNDDLKLKATYGTGFKTPSLFNLFDPMFGNTKLNPEESTTWDAGIEKYFLNYSGMFGLTYFENYFDNLIGFDNSFRAVNINKAFSKGIEVTASLKKMGDFDFNFNYTFTEAKEKVSGISSTYENLIRRPKNKTTLLITYSPTEKIRANLIYSYIGEREDKDFMTYSRVKLKSYSLVNITGEYKLFEFASLTGRIENALNQYYEEVLYYGTLGRSAYLGVNINF